MNDGPCGIRALLEWRLDAAAGRISEKMPLGNFGA